VLVNQRWEAPPEVTPKLQFDKLCEVKPRDLLIRFALGALIAITAAMLGKAFSPRFGGAFLAFPAILPASLTLIEEKEGTRRADRNAIGAVLGGVGLVVFGAIGESTCGRVSAVIAIVCSLAGWILVSVGLYALLAFLDPDRCDRNERLIAGSAAVGHRVEKVTP
jgi:hypothetical protein